MKTLYLTIRNLKTNLQFYSLYLFSVSVVIVVFFAFSSFSVNYIILEKISEFGRVESMCRVISVFLMAFAVFYMAHSNRFFLKRRSKELGIYALLGFRKSAVLRLLVLENILVCAGALAVGLLLGAAAHKGIVRGITALLKLTVDNAKIPFFNLAAVAKTTGFVLVVVLVLSLSNALFLFKSSLIDLIRFEKKAEKCVKIHALPAALGLVLTLAGYALALNIFKGAKSLWATVGFYQVGMLTALLVIAGTALLISAFLPYALHRSKANKRTFYTEIRLITTSNFIYRIRSNAKTLIMLALLSSAALSISSAMALTLYYPIAAVSRIAPSEIEFRLESAGQEEAAKEIVRKYAADDAVTFTRTDIYKVTSSAAKLPVEYSAGTSKGDAENEKILREAGFDCISYSSCVSLFQAQRRYEAAAALPVPGNKECILVKYQPNSDKSSEKGDVYPLLIGGAYLPLTVIETTLNTPLSFANSICTLIVSDGLYERLEATSLPAASVLSINGAVLEDNELLYDELKNMLNQSPYLQGHSHRINELFRLNSSTFLLIGFLVVLFFVALGSILYFNNFSAVMDTKADYDILGKLGYSSRQIERIIKKQILSFFGVPFVLGAINCVFASLVYKTGLMQNLLGNSLSQYLPSVFAVALTALIYLMYYFLTAHSCCKAVRRT